MLIPLSVLSAALAIMHLDLYVAGRESIIKLYKEQGPQDPEMAALLECWPSVFLASSVIVNRETPFHRDHNSRVQWFDLLASIGCYPGSVFDMPTLGTACYYPPGSVIGISGNLVRHGVARTDGDRLCLASYMRDNVHSAMGVPRSNSVCHQDLERLWRENR